MAKAFNKDVLQAIKDKFNSDDSDIGKKLVEKIDSYLEPVTTDMKTLSESSQDESSNEAEPPALEALEMVLKAILDQITDSIIDEVVDNKLEGDNQMKEHTDSLDKSMDHVLTMGQHFSKMMMQHGDEGMKAFYTKAHSFAMKLADLMKEHRKSMGLEAYKEKEMPYYEASFGEKVDVDSIKALAESTERVARESLREMAHQLESKEGVIKSLSEKIESYEKADLIKEAIKEGKLTTGMKQWALSQKTEDLKSYLKIAPKMIPTGEIVKDIAPSVMPVEKEVSLSETDMIMIRDLGISKEQYLKAKAQKGYK